MRLLLVEDNNDHALLITRCLKREFGFELFIEVAQTGEEAYERLTMSDSLDEPELVVSDIRLPGISGLELLHKVREAHDQRPFILVTNSSQQQLAIKALRYGADDFVTKGSDFPENLVGAVVRAQEHAHLQRDLAAARERLAEMELPLRDLPGSQPLRRLAREYEATRAQLQDIGERLRRQGRRLVGEDHREPGSGEAAPPAG